MARKRTAKRAGTRKRSTTRKKTAGRKKTARKKTTRRKYGKKTGRKVKKVMHEYRSGKLKSGRSGRTVKSRKQAIAIGLSEAREEGDKVPPNPNE